MHNSVSGLQVRLLGPPQFLLNGTPLQLPGRQVSALLAYLAAAGRPVPRDELVELLWAEGSRLYLRQLLRRTRTLLAASDLLIATDDDVQLIAGTDADRFRVLVDAEDYAAALALWPVTDVATEFLAGMAGPTDGYGDWLADQRDQYGSLREAALLALGSQLEQRGQSEAAVGVYRQLLQLDGLAEEAHRGVMRIAMRLGTPELGIQQYETLVRKLRLEFQSGLEPVAETRELAERLHAARHAELGAPAVAPAENLSFFVGRSAELEYLQQLLADPEIRLLSVIGPSGAGKTAVASQILVLRRQAGQPTAWVDAHSVTDSTELLNRIAAALQLRPATESAIRGALETVPERLVIMDNVEADAGLSAVLESLTGSGTFLVTAQEPLAAAGEHAFALSGMTVPAVQEAEDLLSFDAVRLFCDAARRARSDFDPDHDELRQIAQICTAVAGLPLALILAASWTRFMSIGSILQTVLADPLSLHSDLADVAERQRELGGLVATTWVRLPDADRSNLERLSVFAGDFDSQAARSVAGAGLHSMLRFMNLSLLTARAESRLGMHPLVRSWGLYQLEQSGGLTEARERHARYFLDYGDRLYAKVQQSQMNEYLSIVDEERDNFMAALDWLWESRNIEDGISMCVWLVPYWDLGGRVAEALEWSGRFLPEAPRTRRTARLHSGVSAILRRIGRTAEAEEHGVTAHTMFAELQDHHNVAMELGNLAMIARQRTEFDTAAKYYEQALSVIRPEGETYALTVLLNNYGVLLKSMGDVEKSLAVHQECLAMRQRLNDDRGVIHSLANIALILHELGRVADANQLRREMLAMPQLHDGNVSDRMRVCLDLGRGEMALGNLDEAETVLAPVLAQARESGDRVNESYAVAHLAHIALRRDNLPESERLYKEALRAMVDTSNLVEAASMIEGLAWVASINDQGEYAHTAANCARNLRLEIGVEAASEMQNQLTRLLGSAGDSQSRQPVEFGSLDEAVDWLLSNSAGKRDSVPLD